MSSEVKANKLSPATGTALQISDSGDTTTIPSGATLDVSSATMTGFTIPSGQTLTVASGGTITNSGTATGFGEDNTPSFSAYPSGGVACSASTWTKVSLQTERWDTDSAFDSTTNYRFTVPAGEGGKYVFHYAVTNTGLDDNESLNVALYKNGSRENNGYTWQYSANTNKYINIVASVVLDLSATDYIELWTMQNENETRSVEAAYTYLTGFKLAGV